MPGLRRVPQSGEGAAVLPRSSYVEFLSLKIHWKITVRDCLKSCAPPLMPNVLVTDFTNQYSFQKEVRLLPTLLGPGRMSLNLNALTLEGLLDVMGGGARLLANPATSYKKSNRTRLHDRPSRSRLFYSEGSLIVQLPGSSSFNTGDLL